MAHLKADLSWVDDMFEEKKKGEHMIEKDRIILSSKLKDSLRNTKGRC